jgi:hypothetical protein
MGRRVAAAARLETAPNRDGQGEGGMSAYIIQFPQRRQLSIRIEREEPAWLVIRGEHGWLFGCRREAVLEARELARQDGVGIAVQP